MVTLFFSPDFCEHLTGRGHPESPERLRATVSALKNLPWADQLTWQHPKRDRKVLDWVKKLHNPDYVEQVRQIALNGGAMLDADTVVSPASYEVALLAVAAWLDGVDSVLNSGEPAFVLARPPGHHAESSGGMGFCLFSNAAIAAHYALTKTGIERVAILDWDVHHGNGTQEMVERDPQIFYCSLHQSPCYPGTGRASETGAYENVLNLPLAPGQTIETYGPLFRDKIVPTLQNFKPDLLIISAGYDANHADPLASMSLQPDDYGIFSRYCQQICDRRLFGLEGGYDLDALAQSVIATIAAC
ncbi:MAG: histone deacetylase [Cyanobacteria bacterium P01_H01_bin.15]